MGEWVVMVVSRKSGCGGRGDGNRRGLRSGVRVEMGVGSVDVEQ